MNILVIAHFAGLLNGANNNRFVEICKLLGKTKSNNVEFVTSDFSHMEKSKQKITPAIFDFKITLLHESGYSKNVCLKRLKSHYEFGKNVKKYLAQREKPDVIYCSVPSLTAAKKAAEYCKKNNIRFIIDIQDLWPEAFKMVFRVPVISNLLFAPITAWADAVYRQADEITAVSQTYVDRALRVNKKCKSGLSVFLGTNLSDFDNYAAKAAEKSNEEIRLAYCGTLGHSYDLKCIMDAMYILKRDGFTNLKFIIMGGGPLKSEFIEYAEQKEIDCEFTGMLPYPQMVERLCSCDIAVNPIRKGSAGSIINKVGDYAMAGLPVINTQECPEYRKLVNEYQMGFNCENGNAEDAALKLRLLLEDKALRLKMGANARRCGVEKFDRGVNYGKIIETIVGI